jgi:hypothetical protein
MNDRDIEQTGAVDTVHGAGIGIYQDHDGIRLDAGFHEHMLNQAAAIRLRDAIETALYLAACWEARNEDD